MMKEERRTKRAQAEVPSKAKGSNVGFEVNPYYEHLLEIREQKPAAYRVMSAATRLAVEAYVKAKEADARLHEQRPAA